MNNSIRKVFSKIIYQFPPFFLKKIAKAFSLYIWQYIKSSKRSNFLKNLVLPYFNEPYLDSLIGQFKSHKIKNHYYAPLSFGENIICESTYSGRLTSYFDEDRQIPLESFAFSMCSREETKEKKEKER